MKRQTASSTPDAPDATRNRTPLLARLAVARGDPEPTPIPPYDPKLERAETNTVSMAASVWATQSLVTNTDTDPTSDELTDR